MIQSIPVKPAAAAGAPPPASQAMSPMAYLVKQELNRLLIDIDGLFTPDQLSNIAYDDYVSAVLVRLLMPLSALEADQGMRVMNQLCQLVYQPAEYSPDDGAIDSDGCLESALDDWQGPQGSKPIQEDIDQQAPVVKGYLSQAWNTQIKLNRVMEGSTTVEYLSEITEPGTDLRPKSTRVVIRDEESRKLVQTKLELQLQTLNELASKNMYMVVRDMILTGHQMANVARLEYLFSQSADCMASPQVVAAATTFDTYHQLLSLNNYYDTKRVKTNSVYSRLKMEIAWTMVLLWWKARADRPKDPNPAQRLRLEIQLAEYLLPATGASPRLVALAKIEELLIAIDSSLDSAEFARLSLIVSNTSKQNISRLQLVEYLQSGHSPMTEEEYRNAIVLAIYKFWLEE